MANAVLHPRLTTYLPYRRVDRSPTIAVGVLVIGFAAAIAATLNAVELWVLTAAAIAAVVIIQPRFGLYLSVLVICLDPGIGVLRPVAGVMFEGMRSLIFSPLELLVILTTVAWLVNSPRPRRWPNKYTTMLLVPLAFVLAIAIFRGIDQGGNFRIALWEVRGTLIAIPFVFLASGLITERAHLLALAGCFIGALLYLTIESSIHYLFVVRVGVYAGELEQAFDHATAVLVSTLVVGGLIWALWGPDKKQRLIALAIAVFAFAVLLTMRRRAAMITADMGILVVGLILMFREWRRFLVIAPVLAVVAAVYLAAFWNNPDSLGQPARAIRSVTDSQSLDARDIASDDYRLREKLNAWWGIQANPVLGSGFGQPYEKPLPMVDLSSMWPFWDYMPHNTFLWVWLKAGVFAFMLLLILCGTALMQFMHVARYTRDPVIMATATFGAVYVAMLVLFAYVDLGLANHRMMLIFGVLLGLIPLLKRSLAAEAGAEKGSA